MPLIEMKEVVTPLKLIGINFSDQGKVNYILNYSIVLVRNFSINFH